MKEYRFTKLAGRIAGFLTILGAAAFGLLALLAAGLSKAWETSQKINENASSYLTIFLLMLVLGIMTTIGTFGLRHKIWKVMYTCFSIMIGISFIVLFFVSFGSIGTKIELFLLLSGVVYLLLSFTVVKRY